VNQKENLKKEWVEQVYKKCGKIDLYSNFFNYHLLITGATGGFFGSFYGLLFKAKLAKNIQNP